MPIGHSGAPHGPARRNSWMTPAAEHLREQRFRALLEGVPVAAYRWEAGSAGRCLYVSPQIESMLGYSPAQWMADPELWMERIHPDDRAQVDERRGRGQADGPARQRVPLPARRRAHRVGARPGPLGRRRGRAGLLRGRLRRCHRAQAGGARAHAHGAARSAHRPRQPAPVHAAAGARARPRATPGRAPCCSSTSTASSSSTTATATRPATRCCARPGGALQAALREGDVLSRFGGDEFTAYLPDCEAGCAETVARRVLATLAEPFPVARGEVYVGGSVGIALSGGDSETATDLIRDADVAMYAAKQGGRGRLQLFDTSLREASARRVEIVSALHRALELNEIELLLQPIVDLSDDRLAGVEALHALAARHAAGTAARVRAPGRGGRPDRRDRALRAGRGLPARPAARGAARRGGRGQRQRLAAACAAGRSRGQRRARPAQHGLRSRRACSWS